MSAAKPAGRSVRDISPDRLARLNAGEIEAATLTVRTAVEN